MVYLCLIRRKLIENCWDTWIPWGWAPVWGPEWEAPLDGEIPAGSWPKPLWLATCGDDGARIAWKSGLDDGVIAPGGWKPLWPLAAVPRAAMASVTAASPRPKNPSRISRSGIKQYVDGDYKDQHLVLGSAKFLFKNWTPIFLFNVIWL